MPRIELLRQVPIERSARIVQLEGIFDLEPSGQAEFSLDADLSELDSIGDWNIGLIVGPSGSGKTALATELFGKPWSCKWPRNQAILDNFPAKMPIRDVVAFLSSVGFSSPPSWRKPYSVLSTGEQFRVDLALALVRSKTNRKPVVIDEFTSVVDRRVAQVGSCAVAKAIRRYNRRAVMVSCHYDIIDWLQPDWIYKTADGEFQWRCLQPRPEIKLDVYETTRETWRIFRRHHYLNTTIHRGARCFVACVGDQPAAFASAIHRPISSGATSRRRIWAEHRTVCLPDFQGIGIGNNLSDTIAAYFVSLGHRYRSTTSHPAMIRHRARSPLWDMARPPGVMGVPSPTARISVRQVGSLRRATASFEYVGPPWKSLMISQS